MSNIETGGPAFPVREAMLKKTQPGMTLRDYFAAKAMQAHVQALSTASLPDWNAEIARLSYLTADAMLKARDAC